LKESLRCPQANLSEEEAKKCKAILQPVAEVGNDKLLSGAELVSKKYPCASCHNFDKPGILVGPSLYDVGTRHDAAYIRAKLHNPDATVVEGFADQKGKMKQMLASTSFFSDIDKNPDALDTLVSYLVSLKGGGGKEGGQAAAAVLVMPNFGLNDEELQSVVTFLLGLQEQNVPWPQKSFAQKAVANGQTAPADGGSTWAAKSGEELVKLAGCIACHKFDGPESLVGPSLWDIGGRQGKEYIRESILDPDHVIVPGYPAGVMKATLTSTGFYQKISIEGLDRIVDYLATLKGKP